MVKLPASSSKSYLRSSSFHSILMLIIVFWRSAFLLSWSFFIALQQKPILILFNMPLMSNRQKRFLLLYVQTPREVDPTPMVMVHGPKANMYDSSNGTKKNFKTLAKLFFLDWIGVVSIWVDAWK